MARIRTALGTLAFVALGTAAAANMGGLAGAPEHGQLHRVYGSPAGYVVQVLPVPAPTPPSPTTIAQRTPMPQDGMPDGDGW